MRHPIDLTRQQIGECARYQYQHHAYAIGAVYVPFVLLFKTAAPQIPLRCRGGVRLSLQRAGHSLLESNELTRIESNAFFCGSAAAPHTTSCNTTKTWYCSTPKKSPLAAPRKLQLPVKLCPPASRCRQAQAKALSVLMAPLRADVACGRRLRQRCAFKRFVNSTCASVRTFCRFLRLAA